MSTFGEILDAPVLKLLYLYICVPPTIILKVLYSFAIYYILSIHFSSFSPSQLMSISPSFHLYQNIHAIKLLHCYSLLLLPLTIARRLIFIHICAVLYLQLSCITSIVTILSMPIRVISFLKG